MVEKISIIHSRESIGYEICIKQLLFDILYQLIRDSQAVVPCVTNQKSVIIRDVLNYIEDNYSEQIGLSELANVVHISKEYLCRVFHTVSDVSLIEYLNRFRIRKSAYMLINTSKNISEISCFCGFNNSSYFNKLFKRYMGCTPKQYRTVNKYS